MKVAWICADSGIPVFGQKGASIHIQEVLRVLLRHGAEVVLFTCRSGGESPDEFRGVKVVSLPPMPDSVDEETRARAALENNEALVRLMEAEGPFDVVYERYSLWSYAGIVWAKQTGIPTILEVNAPLPEEQRRYRQLVLETEAFQVLDQLLIHADILVAVSDGVKHWLNTFAPSRGKVHVVANGVDPARFRAHHTRSGRGLTLGFVGTLKPWHGLHILIDAFILLRHENYDVTLSVIGHGPESIPMREKLAQAGLLAFADFHGAVAPSQVPALLEQVDIGIAPYPQFDNFYFSPLKIYEYMAAGLPVITSRTGHLAELVKDRLTGLLVEPESPQALADAVIELYNDPALRKRLGQAGRQRAEKYHSWERVVRHIWQLAGIELAAGEPDES